MLPMRRAYRALLRLVEARNPPITITIQKLEITVPAGSVVESRGPRRAAKKTAATPGRRARGRFTCPLCRYSADEFKPFGNPARPDAWCPRCRSLERTRLLWLTLQRSFDIEHRTLRLLHVAPERSLRRALRSRKTITYVSADLSLKRADVVADLVKGMPFADGAFDAVICSHVLEHVDDDRAALREIARVLAPEGLAFLMVPIDSGRTETFEDPSVTDPQERLRLFGQTDHVRRYGLDFEQRLAETGFDFDVVTAESLLSHEEAVRFRCDRGAGFLHVARKAAG